ncbi:16S rRNA (uracil(1498)-N(3))-methyltransferase, partial [Salmonella enterica subsp. enterica serovar Indiana]|nr:16S rRNA (uracil(1498)-N(3))-methyltransferase [Salmonella enterica subsp. enterica serovar Indiana]
MLLRYMYRVMTRKMSPVGPTVRYMASARLYSSLLLYKIAVSMERSIVKLNEAKVAKKIERWQKIIKEAAEQSYRLVIPS